MVSQMTNRLLATVIAFAVSTGVAAHAAQDPRHPLPGVTVSELQSPGLSLHKLSAPRVTVTATSLPQAVQTAATHLTEVATAAVDPSGAIRAASQRDHIALEHLRQQASALKGSAHPAFNQLISRDEAALIDLEKTGLASNGTSTASSIAQMDQLVASAQAALSQAESQPAATKTQGNGRSK